MKAIVINGCVEKRKMSPVTISSLMPHSMFFRVAFRSIRPVMSMNSDSETRIIIQAYVLEKNLP